MNRNDKEWDVDNEFWDNEADDDDDEDYNGIGDDIDANNDETFDNAAEWNEDEHEELIARDSILSHTIRGNVSSSNSNRSNLNATLDGIPRAQAEPSRQILRVDELERQLLKTRITQDSPSLPTTNTNTTSESSKRSGWSPFGGKDIFTSSDPLTRLDLETQRILLQSQMTEALTLEQQQQQLLQQHQILQHRHQLQQMAISKQQQDQRLIPTNNASESSKRSGWSPFGGKDIFTNPDPLAKLDLETQKILLQSQMTDTLTQDQQRQLLLQRHQILQHQQQLQQMAIIKQQQIQQEQRLMAQNPQCFTVEELERQMIGNRPNTSNPNQTNKPEERNVAGYCFLAHIPQTTSNSVKANENQHERHNNAHERRDRTKHEKFELYDRDDRDTRSYRERRDARTHRDQRDRQSNNRYHTRKRLTIIPPQVQLSVIDQAKRLHSITAMHPDEFLQDRLPTSQKGFLFKRHSTIMEEKINHDGVLTEKERSWLTKIQEKIQADYDDNLDQDYYYLLYFNRFSMTDKAAQKPSGPGVLDRRFIPRERLLYNSNT